MMDISDGLDKDLREILGASGCGAEVELGEVPVSDELVRLAEEKGWDVMEMVLFGGEDYELMFTVGEDDIEGVKRRYWEKFGRELYVVGRIRGKELKLKYMRGGEEVMIQGDAYDHFKETQKK